MKKILFALMLAGLLQSSFAQTVAEWQADVRHLQQIIHSKYQNLFHTITAAEWDSAVDNLHSRIPSLNKTEVLAGFVNLVALFHIGHTQMNTWGLHNTGGKLQLHRYPFQLYWFSDGIYILRAEKKYEQAVGGRIIRMGKMKAEDAAEAVRPLVSYENEYGFKSNSMYYLAIPEFIKTQGISDEEDEVEIVYIKNGSEKKITVKTGDDNGVFGMTGLETAEGWASVKPDGETPLWQKEPSAFRYMQFLGNSKTLYVRHSVTLNDGSKTIADFFSGVSDFIDKNDVQRLILDIRMNGGGNNYLNKAIIKSIIESKKINQPGKFFCIIGRRTFSAAQNLVNELEKYTEVTFVGEPTSENVNFYGDTRSETLPNSNLNVNLSWMWWQNLDPRDKRKATYPALAADFSFDDYVKGKDPAFDVINKYGGGASIEKKLRELVVAEKFSEATALVQQYLQNPVYQYFKDNLETKINDYGYNLINQKKHELANKVLYMNVQLFPQSANVYDSYAESFMHMGKNEEALKYYEIAIAKDKEGITADNAKKMIEKIKSATAGK